MEGGTSIPEEDIRRKVHVGFDIPRKRLDTEVEIGTNTCLKLRLLAGASPPTLPICRKNMEFTGPNRDLNSVSLTLSTLGHSLVG